MYHANHCFRSHRYKGEQKKKKALVKLTFEQDMYQFFFAHLAKIQQNKERDESAKASGKARPPQEGAAVATGTSRSFHVLRPLRVAKPHELI